MPVSESQFVEWVQGSGGVILVSPIWLQEVISLLHFDLKLLIGISVGCCNVGRFLLPDIRLTLSSNQIYRTVLDVDLLTLSEFDLTKPSTLLSLLEKFSQVST